MADQTVRGGQYVVNAYAEPNLLDYLELLASQPQDQQKAVYFVGIFGVDVVFNTFSTRLFHVLGRYLDQIAQRSLIDVLALQVMNPKSYLTRMNIWVFNPTCWGRFKYFR